MFPLRNDFGLFTPSWTFRLTIPFHRSAANMRRLMDITRDLDRKTRPNIKLGICGEYGSEPSSLNSATAKASTVSCSPYRVPIAKLAAAQAALE
jgi:phosphoenolpyruvate synthase/pyruvate phosphate dikinase